MSRFIDADATIELFKNGLPECENCDKTIPCVECIIHKAPTEDVQPVTHGNMFIFSDNNYEGVCSICSSTIFVIDKYCSECGAKMDDKVLL